ncbi:MAG: hypothetical protein J0H85_09925 [Sediminibacterium magnilacihabitans]|jgi:hypothetical protein|nr:hypothetical protein [Sediminibacterium magnilacihabitans]PQV60152.1 hypothetical protein CLV53_11083 [Sediminibacterium magnilacihabitans]
MIRSFLTLLSICLATTLMAQEAGQSPAPDQNPNFNISRQKYMSQKDSLLSASNTTVQQTYKAYDWYEAKMERRNERREARRYAAYYNGYYYPYYNQYYNGWNQYGYYNNWGSWNALRPNIGFHTGNWWFSF